MKFGTKTELPRQRPVIVTGGTRGTGAAIARNLAKLGHPVAVNYVASKDAAETVVSAIQAAGAKAAAIPGNVSSPARIEAISTAAEAALGPLAHPGQQRRHHREDRSC